MKIWTRALLDVEALGKDAVVFLENVAEEEVTALAPIVEAGIASVVKDVAILNTPAGWLAALASTALAILPQLEAAGLKVAGQSLLTAIGSGLTKLQSAAAPAVPAAA